MFSHSTDLMQSALGIGTASFFAFFFRKKDTVESPTRRETPSKIIWKIEHLSML